MQDASLQTEGESPDVIRESLRASTEANIEIHSCLRELAKLRDANLRQQVELDELRDSYDARIRQMHFESLAAVDAQHRTISALCVELERERIRNDDAMQNAAATYRFTNQVETELGELDYAVDIALRSVHSVIALMPRSDARPFQVLTRAAAGMHEVQQQNLASRVAWQKEEVARRRQQRS